MKYAGARIENGKIYGVKFSEYFTVQLGNANPSICPVIDFDHMPVETLVKLAFDSMKVKGRPAMKRLDTETLKRTYQGTISWRVMLSKDGAAQHQVMAEMSDDEIEASLAKIKARRAALRAAEQQEAGEEPAAATDDDIEDLKMENDDS